MQFSGEIHPVGSPLDGHAFFYFLRSLIWQTESTFLALQIAAFCHRLRIARFSRVPKAENK
jgi:hypothetical protein